MTVGFGGLQDVVSALIAAVSRGWRGTVVQTVVMSRRARYQQESLHEVTRSLFVRPSGSRWMEFRHIIDHCSSILRVARLSVCRASFSVAIGSYFFAVVVGAKLEGGERRVLRGVHSTST